MGGEVKGRQARHLITWVAQVTGAMEILRRTVQMGEPNLFLYKEGD